MAAFSTPRWLIRPPEERIELMSLTVRLWGWWTPHVFLDGEVLNPESWKASGTPSKPERPTDRTGHPTPHAHPAGWPPPPPGPEPPLDGAGAPWLPRLHRYRGWDLGRAVGGPGPPGPPRPGKCSIRGPGVSGGCCWPRPVHHLAMGITWAGPGFATTVRPGPLLYPGSGTDQGQHPLFSRP
ncbi:hypothetical protein QJS66_19370 [Kocuria rhizophila]|nr:hypothetical protein QJS66_19370 [Kocuria rhizophila]